MATVALFLTTAIICFILLGSLDGCLHGYVPFEHSCYHYSHDLESWADAMTICKMDGGYLAEISFERENNFIKSLVNGSAGGGWIGGADLTVEGEWKWWFTRTKLAYTNWRVGEPNNDKQNENCMQFEVKGTWNDLSCHTLDKYICEMSDEITEIIG